LTLRHYKAKEMKPFLYTIYLMVVFLSEPMGLLGQTIRLMPAWETDSLFSMPESAAFDSINNCIYISNFNDEGGFRKKEDTLRNEFISKIDCEGNIIELNWVDGLYGPTGIALLKERLYAVERGFVAIVDISTGSIQDRIAIPDFGFPNDIAVAPDGIMYISDSERNCIYRFDGQKIEHWLSNSLFTGINCLYVDGDYLIVGNSGINTMLRVNFSTRQVSIMAKNALKFADGIARFGNEFIVAGETRIAQIDTTGSPTGLIDADNSHEWYADFYLIGDQNLLIVPTLFTNRVVAFRIIDL
jgi:hypothetical protein